MNEAIDFSGYMETLPTIGFATMMILQWIKQFPFWRNCWCERVAPIVGLILGILALAAAGKISAEYVDYVALYNGAIESFTAGVAAVLGYKIQRPLNIFPPGPDNHKLDALNAIKKEEPWISSSSTTQ